MRTSVHFLLWSLGLAEAETATTEAERDCLAGLAAGKRRVVEIGVWHGVSTRRLRRAMDPGGVLFAVDPYPPGRLGFSFPRLIARREVAGVSGAAVRWMRMTAVEAASRLAASGAAPVELVFIDGDHSYDGLAADWTSWSPLVASGGLVALHDSRSSETRSLDGAGSARYTREHILVDPRFELAQEVDTLSVLRRKT